MRQFIDQANTDSHSHTTGSTFQNYIRMLGAIVSHPGIHALTKGTPICFSETEGVVLAGVRGQTEVSYVTSVTQIWTVAITGVP